MVRGIRDETGAITAFSLFLFIAAIAFGGLAVDMAYTRKTQTELQISADAAARLMAERITEHLV